MRLVTGLAHLNENGPGPGRRFRIIGFHIQESDRFYNGPMSTFAQPAVKAAVRQRVERLTPVTPRQWGRMTPHQMVCHLTDAYRMSSGERRPKAVDNFISRSIVRLVALHTPLAWPKGVKTIPEADQEQGGTRPLEWDRDVAELLRSIDAFRPLEGHPHPMFGPLTEQEWDVWGFRHADHHLRQFGL